MQKNQKVAIALVVLFLFGVVGSYTIARTYAKYTSSVNANSEARVAKWAWKINNETLTNTTTTFKMDLFKNSELLNSDCTAKEGNVVAQDGVIAPGTCGKFTINLTNESEVNAKYAYTLAATTAGIPIEFSEDKTSWKSISDFNKSDSIGMNASANRTLYWRWAFESGTTDAEKLLPIKLILI